MAAQPTPQSPAGSCCLPELRDNGPKCLQNYYLNFVFVSLAHCEDINSNVS